MFGYPAGFVNGNMFCGLFQESLFLRLGESERAELLAMEGASPFEPMPGRPMREYVVMPMEMLEDAETTRAWIRRAFRHVAALPPKASRATGRAGAVSAAKKGSGRKNVAAKITPAARKTGRASARTQQSRARRAGVARGKQKT